MDHRRPEPRGLQAGLAAGHSQPEWFRLRREAEELALRPAFDRLITLDHNTIKELPHQIKVAEQVLSRPMVGRAILADEVGGFGGGRRRRVVESQHLAAMGASGCGEHVAAARRWIDKRPED